VTANNDYFDDFVRISLPVPAIDVDTTDAYLPPLDQVVDFLTAAD
jgi:hypothetical protein